MKQYHSFFCDECLSVHENIVSCFSKLTEKDYQQQTHFFHGRFENIYFEDSKIPDLKIILHRAVQYSKQVLNNDRELKYSFWFNVMKPGDITTAHTHDDDDELLSGVYYLKVPENSGDLIIGQGKEKEIITPKEGLFIFFKPDVLHEVSVNKSNESRISVAFNFGVNQEL